MANPVSSTYSMRRQCFKGNPGICTVSQKITPAACTDGTSTSGYQDFTDSIPACSIVLGWKAVTRMPWTGDTTAVLMVGVSGDTNLYSNVESGSVLTAGTIASGPDDGLFTYTAAAVTARVTITGGGDFTTFVTDGTAETTVTIYYLCLAG
jgi:hypothetical protein